MTDGIIAALATAWGEGAVAIVRISGAGAVRLVDGFFRPAGKCASLAASPPRKMVLGDIVEPDSDGRPVVLDRVLAVRFERGASYTGEESVEIHCHGGTAAAGKCLALSAAGGARAAQPGEFTKRAFLSGRLDLAQAEAVMDIVKARSDEALRAAGRSLHGELSAALRDLLDGLTHLRAEVEVRMDYPEEVDDDEEASLCRKLQELRVRTMDLLGRCRVGVMLKNGLATAIVGRANVGKSSLLNALLGEERAIVTEVPGTTRDTVDATLVYRGLPMCIVDTAGFRKTDDAVENMGIARSRKAIERADVCLLVTDSAGCVTEAERELLAAAEGKPVLCVVNKIDLRAGPDREQPAAAWGCVRFLETSALTGAGIEALKEAMFEIAAQGTPLSEGYAATERVLCALRQALSCIDGARQALADAAGMDIAGSLLAEAAAALAAPLGADASEELLDAVFANFCIGK